MQLNKCSKQNDKSDVTCNDPKLEILTVCIVFDTVIIC